MATKRDKIDFRGTQIELIEKATRNPIGILGLFGAWFTNELRKAFRTQGARAGGGQSTSLARKGVPPPMPWAPRRVPNVPGVLADLAAGSTPKSRRFVDRPALIDTGRLRDSIAWRPIGRDKIEVGTVVPYADLHQQGGVTTVTVTQKMKDALAKWLKKSVKAYRRFAERGGGDQSEVNAEVADYRRSFGWIFSAKGSVQFRVRPRPFITFGDLDLKKLHELLLRWLRRGGSW